MNRNSHLKRLEEIENFAEDIVLTCLGDHIPIDPFALAGEDKIILFGDNFNGAFDGMAEAIDSKFIIYYDNTLGENHPRTRFTIAHELGHCEIEEHRKYLLSGGIPNPCKVENFSQENEEAEWEADTFAASFLLPQKIIKPKINKQEPTMSLFKDLSCKMNTSLTCTLIRCVLISDYACAAIMIKNGRVCWSFISNYMKELGLSYIKNGYTPLSSKSIKNINFSSGKLEVANLCDTNVWFEEYMILF